MFGPQHIFSLKTICLKQNNIFFVKVTKVAILVKLLLNYISLKNHLVTICFIRLFRFLLLLKFFETPVTTF